MAQAEKSKAQIKVTETKEVDAVTLTLSPMEAAALRAICGRIMGGDGSSIRGYSSRVYYALDRVVDHSAVFAMNSSIKMDMDAHPLAGPFRPANNPPLATQ